MHTQLSQASSVVQAMAAEKQAMLAEIERLRCQLSVVSTSGAPAPAPAPATASLGALLEAGDGDGGAGRLPPLIEQAQRMAAAKLVRHQRRRY